MNQTIGPEIQDLDGQGILKTMSLLEPKQDLEHLKMKDCPPFVNGELLNHIFFINYVSLFFHSRDIVPDKKRSNWDNSGITIHIRVFSCG